MADLEARIAESFEDEAADIEMVGEEAVVGADPDEETAEHGENGEAGDNEVPIENDEEVPTRVTFVDYLKSPIVELVVGEGEEQIILTAHQALLQSSPFFEEALSQFNEDSTVSILNLSKLYHEGLYLRSKSALTWKVKI
jgi:hypothetical protein